MDPKLFLKAPPPLDPAWLAHETAANLLAPQPVITDAAIRQQGYSQRCKTLNAELLSSRDTHLATRVITKDTLIQGECDTSSFTSSTIPIRSYSPFSKSSLPLLSLDERNPDLVVIYYHGGGLYVGDLDSEDLTCRRICDSFQCTVYSVEYRLMPQHSADDALADAYSAFKQLTANKTFKCLILMGSSSGGQLAAQVSQLNLKEGKETRIHGIALRGPVTCDATDGGVNLPLRWREKHFSMSPGFHTSLLLNPAVNAENRTVSPMPLEVVDIGGLPKHWIQVCTNDIYYSDGVCYAAALTEAVVEVKLDVVSGWPHTFWLKAPYLERAVQAEKDMLEGLRWLIQSLDEENV